MEGNKKDKLTIKKLYEEIRRQIHNDDEKDVFIENADVDVDVYKKGEFTENADELNIITEKDIKKILKKRVHFINCTINGDFTINDNKYFKSIILEDCKIEGNLEIKNNKTQINIKNCEIKKNLIIEENQSEININMCIINENIIIKNNEDKVSLNGDIRGIIKGNIEISGNNKHVFLNGLTVMGYAFFSDENNNENNDENNDKDNIKFLKIYDSRIKGLTLNKVKISNLFILKKTFVCNFLILKDAEISEGECRNNQINFLKIYGGSEKNISFSLDSNNQYLGIIENKIIGDHSNNKLLFEGIYFTKVKFENFIGGNNISFVNCNIKSNLINFIKDDLKKELENQNNKISEKIKFINNCPSNDKDINSSLFEIEKSNLDKTQFHSFNIDKDTEVKIENSNLTDIITTNFPLLKNVESSDVDGQREVYRQLKYHASKQGDSYKALYYYEKEMSTLIKVSKKRYDKILLYVGKYISNHGTNWVLVLLWIFVINILLFILFLYSSGVINDILPTFSDILNTLNDLFKYGYPLTKIEDLKKSLNLSSISPGSEFIFYLTKIINAVLLYHLIISFRKFNKKF